MNISFGIIVTKTNCQLLLALILLGSCRSEINSKLLYRANESLFTYHGRILEDHYKTSFIGSASGVEFSATGDSLELRLKSDNGRYNYLSIAIDNKYYDRVQIYGDTINTVKIKLSNEKKLTHEIGVFKATEASNGTILFYGAKARKLDSARTKKKVTIEFIGNSITCGMGADSSSIPCGDGEWYDQHNAYLAYGPRVARSLNSNYILSSVSGIGMYRNWNDENHLEPIMPDVYDNLFLNTNTDIPYTYSNNFAPNIIAICLGTNDLSDGDGLNPRKPFDSEKFITNYTDFVTRLFNRNPNAKIALLTSPMLSGKKEAILMECLLEVQNYFSENQKISIFEFRPFDPSGCTSHPNVDEHEIMAEQLAPFLKKLID